MVKIDLKKQYKDLYTPSAKKFTILEIPKMNFIMIDGHGDPNNEPSYTAAIETLYSLSYTLKFHVKKTIKMDYTVMGLEGLWWVPDMKEFNITRKEDWDWTAMIMQPDFITPSLFEEAKRQVIAKGKGPRINEARFESFYEGLCVQVIYIGPFNDEGPTIANMHTYAKEQGYDLAGKHHEIYLSDFRRTAPEKLKTVIRQPLKKA